MPSHAGQIAGAATQRKRADDYARTVLTHVAEGLTTAELAAALDVKPSSVREIVYRSRRRLRDGGAYRTVPCPTCRAVVGHACVSPNGNRRNLPHKSRVGVDTRLSSA